MSTCSTNASNVFIDLATFSELEGYLYGGPDSITWFVAAIQKSNWFSYIPITLRHTGTIDFGQRNVSASVNRSGDYVMSVWFRCRIPQIGFVADVNDAATLRWTRNLMHNIFDKVTITFNELTVQEFDSFWLDMNYQFRKPGAKRIGYKNMIGDVGSMIDPVVTGTPLGTGGYFSVPLPFWFGEDSGVALPVAALPFNDIKINYTFRRWEELVIITNGPVGPDPNPTINDVVVYESGAPTTSTPSMIDPQTFAHYAVIHNDERVKMGDAPRDILIHQIQCTQAAPFKDVSTTTSFDIRLSHSIVLFCFAAQNTSLYDLTSGSGGGEWSNYTTLSTAGIDADTQTASDPIAFTTLVYENTTRLAQGSDYFSLIHPDLLMDAIPDETGYHAWSYSLKPWDPLRPAGSTNYSKLANVSITHDMSPACVNASNALYPDGSDIEIYNTAGAAVSFPQKFRHIFVARNWNIVRVANGSLGHPTL